MIYELILAITLVVAFFICKITTDRQINDYKDQSKGFKIMIASYLSDIELLRRESLDSYRKGLYDGLEINKGKQLNNIDSKPIKTINEHKEIIKTLATDKKEIDLLQQGYDNMMSYDGSIPEERK